MFFLYRQPFLRFLSISISLTHTHTRMHARVYVLSFALFLLYTHTHTHTHTYIYTRTYVRTHRQKPLQSSVSLQPYTYSLATILSKIVNYLCLLPLNLLQVVPDKKA
jgi:hypothetical protein